MLESYPKLPGSVTAEADQSGSERNSMRSARETQFRWVEGLAVRDGELDSSPSVAGKSQDDFAAVIDLPDRATFQA